MEKPLIIRGRTIASADIELIRLLSNKYHEHGKTFISRKLAEAWKWVQANGRFKDRACRDILSALERKNTIALPSLRKRPKQRIITLQSPMSQSCRFRYTFYCMRTRLKFIKILAGIA